MKREMLNTIHPSVKRLSEVAHFASVPIAVLGLCVTMDVHSGLAQQSPESAFRSAGEAAQTLFRAVQRNDEQAIENILGGPTELASSHDSAQDELDRRLFAEKYQEMHRLAHEADGSVTLFIGAENWPFPIPLLEKNGGWHFDSDAGLKELLFRQVGENERAAIATCHEFTDEEKDYRSKSSDANLTDSAPSSLVAKVAHDSAGGDPILFHGYYFRMLRGHPTTGSQRQGEDKATGDFALIAYPAVYRSSGVMTFVVTEHNVVYEKDLGPNTASLVSAMAAFHKDATWRDSGE
jgi:hypothetical protein